MPYSSAEGKKWTRDRITVLGARTFLDVGVGAGVYRDMVKSLPWATFITGVEVWEPYVRQFHLKERYNELVLSDARVVLEALAAKATHRVLANKWDVVFLGDILEHMPKEDAVRLWENAKRVAKEGVFLSIPTCHYPQGHEHGNPYEAHVTDNWTVDEVLEAFPGIADHEAGPTVSVFWAPTW